MDPLPWKRILKRPKQEVSKKQKKQKVFEVKLKKEERILELELEKTLPQEEGQLSGRTRKALSKHEKGGADEKLVLKTLRAQTSLELKNKLCKNENCVNELHAKGLCKNCYQKKKIIAQSLQKLQLPRKILCKRLLQELLSKEDEKKKKKNEELIESASFGALLETFYQKM